MSLLVALVGCGLSREAKQQQAFQKSLAEVQARCVALYSDPALGPIARKVALGNAEAQTFEMRTDTNYATDAEKSVIAVWGKKRDECNAALAQVLVLVPGQAGAAVTSAEQATDGLIAQLYLGRITYSEFATRRAQISADLTKAIADAVQAQSAERNAQRNAEIVAGAVARPLAPNPYGYHPPQMYWQMPMGPSQTLMVPMN